MEQVLGMNLVAGPSARSPYQLQGPKGATYNLTRNAHTPDLLFAVNARTGRIVNVKGVEWFRETADGVVVA